MSFFIRPHKNSRQNANEGKTRRKRKVVDSHSTNKIKNEDMDEEISSDSDVEKTTLHVDHPSSDDEETAQEKKLRLAKKYLEELEQQEREKAETDDIDVDAVERRLADELLEQAGKLYKEVADQYRPIEKNTIRIFRRHNLTPVCLVISPDDKYVYSAYKDCSLIKWCCNALKSLIVLKGVQSDSKKGILRTPIFCLAISSDNKFLACGCKNREIYILNPDSMTAIHTFGGHRGAVTGLAFRKGTHQLFSASDDRSVKVWNLDEMVYVESLFGHQDVITAIDAMARDRAITSGGRDNTVRIWKIIEESQMIFNGHGGSIDCVRMINEEFFVSCGDDGLLAVWGLQKKKPLATITAAHGYNTDNGLPNWIVSVAPLRCTNLFASGSCDGRICLWKFNREERSIQPLHSFPICGFVNALQFTNDGKFLIAAVGQEHRLGRWWKIKEAKNSLCIVPLVINP